MKCLKDNSDKPSTLVSGTAADGVSEQELDVLVPSSQTKLICCGCGQSSRIGMSRLAAMS